MTPARAARWVHRTLTGLASLSRSTEAFDSTPIVGLLDTTSGIIKERKDAGTKGAKLTEKRDELQLEVEIEELKDKLKGLVDADES